MPGSRSPQVPVEHYAGRAYDELHRWVSYWYQAGMVASTGAQSLLEVGVGSGVLRWYLRDRLGIVVTSVDIDPALGPDVVSDVLRLSDHFGPGSFDAVCAFQVLEHLPFADLDRALGQLSAVSREHVLISLPNNGRTVRLAVDLGGHEFKFGTKLHSGRPWQFDGQHHWEVGTRGHSRADVRRILDRRFVVDREFAYPEHPYHRAYQMRKRRDG